MSPHPTQPKPAAGPGPPKKARPKLRIDCNPPPTGTRNPAKWKLYHGSPPTPLEIKPVPFDALIAPKSTVFTPPLPFRHKPNYHPPRFESGSRPRCPEELTIAPRRGYFYSEDGTRVRAVRGKAPMATPVPLSPSLIEALVAKALKGEPLNPPVDIPRATAEPPWTKTQEEVPYTDLQSPTYDSDDSLPEIKIRKKRIPRAETPEVQEQVPYTNPQSPTYCSDDCLPRIKTRQKKKHNERLYKEIDDQGRYYRVASTGYPSPDEEYPLMYKRPRPERDPYCCQDVCLCIMAVGICLLFVMATSMIVAEIGERLVRLASPEIYYPYHENNRAGWR